MARLFVNLSEELLGRIQYLAIQEKRSPSEVIEKILGDYFEENLHEELLEMEQVRNELKAHKVL